MRTGETILNGEAATKLLSIVSPGSGYSRPIATNRFGKDVVKTQGEPVSGAIELDVEVRAQNRNRSNSCLHERDEKGVDRVVVG
jgi:hypothetical protein